MDSDQECYLDFVKCQSAITVANALEGQSMVSLKNQDTNTLLKSMRNVLLALNESLNVSSKLTTNQAVEISSIVIEKYYYLKLDEFVLVCKKIKMGELVQLYNRIDMPTICKAIDVFLSSEERTLIFERDAASYKERELNDEIDMQKVYEEYKHREEVDPVKHRRQKDHDYNTWKQNWLNEREKNKPSEL